jgi:hypothetical protein
MSLSGFRDVIFTLHTEEIRCKKVKHYCFLAHEFPNIDVRQLLQSFIDPVDSPLQKDCRRLSALIDEMESCRHLWTATVLQARGPLQTPTQAQNTRLKLYFTPLFEAVAIRPSVAQFLHRLQLPAEVRRQLQTRILELSAVVPLEVLSVTYRNGLEIESYHTIQLGATIHEINSKICKFTHNDALQQLIERLCITAKTFQHELELCSTDLLSTEPHELTLSLTPVKQRQTLELVQELSTWSEFGGQFDTVALPSPYLNWEITSVSIKCSLEPATRTPKFQIEIEEQHPELIALGSK